MTPLMVSCQNANELEVKAILQRKVDYGVSGRSYNTLIKLKFSFVELKSFVILFALRMNCYATTGEGARAEGDYGIAEFESRSFSSNQIEGRFLIENTPEYS